MCECAAVVVLGNLIIIFGGSKRRLKVNEWNHVEGKVKAVVVAKSLKKNYQKNYEISSLLQQLYNSCGVVK